MAHRHCGRRRRPTRRSSSLLLAGTMMAVSVTMAPGAGATPGPASAAGPWTRLPSANVAGQNFEPQAITSPAPGDVWVVGYHEEVVGGAVEFRTLAEHDNGNRFAIVPTPDRETDPAVDMLMGASGTSADDVWAVGTSSPEGAPSQTLIEHWGGSAWTIVQSPDPGSAGDILEGVTALSPDDAWAVGARQDKGDFFQRPMALHWNGTSWSTVAVPEPPGCSGHSYLTAVSAPARNDVWATGWCGSGGDGTVFAYVEHWNGTAWSVSAGEGTTPAGSQLYGISAVGSNVWAVGFTQVPGGAASTGLSLRLVKGVWETVPVPVAGSPSLAAVAALPVGGAWSVGSGESPQPPFSGPYSMQFGRGLWRAMPVASPFARLTSVSIDSGGSVWATGFSIGSDGTDGARSPACRMSSDIGARWTSEWTHCFRA